MFTSLVQPFIWILLVITRLWLWPVTTLIGLIKSRKPLPPIKSHLLKMSASKLASDIRHQKVTCEQVIRAFISRISDVRTLLNCVVEDRFEEALKEAQGYDEMIRKNPDPNYWAKNKPLLGVPLTVKESIATKGLSHTSGRRMKKPAKAEEDSVSVARLKAAGAIPLVVSNTPEYCTHYETHSKAYGTTNNPYDVRRTCGGSSGGEASLLGSGASVIGLGTDMAGSSRLPSFFCGIYGHKPTPGLLSSVGNKPKCSDKEYYRYFTMAPMCRYAEDLPLLLRNVLSDPNKEALLQLDKPVDISKLKIYYMETDGTPYSCKMHKEIKRGLRTSLDYFEKNYGVVPQKLELPLNGIWMGSIAIMMNLKSETVFSKSQENPDEWNSISLEWLKFFCGCSDHSLSALVHGMLKKFGESRPQKKLQQVMLYKEILKRKMRETLGNDGVLICPVFYDLANFHYQISYKLFNTTFCAMFNFLEMPATACPIGVSANGIPIGIQVAVNQFQDRLSFAIAKELEQCFGGWIPPPEEETLTETV